MSRTAFMVWIALLSVLVLAVWWFFSMRETGLRLSAVSETWASRSSLPVEPIYLQYDQRWAAEFIGDSGQRLKDIGCTICCVSMALAHHGVILNPSDINRALKESDGYTERGLVKWDAVRRITDGRVHVILPEKPSNEGIETALTEGNPVLVKVFLTSGVQHWVLLVGREGRDYLMKDPLGDGKTLQKLSSLRSSIHAVRILRKRS